jgi:hypothetical protein
MSNKFPISYKPESLQALFLSRETTISSLKLDLDQAQPRTGDNRLCVSEGKSAAA